MGLVNNNWKIIDLSGMVFERLTVLEFVDIQKGKARWRCACQCGKEIITKGIYLTRGETRSCGCLMVETSKRTGLISGSKNMLKYIDSVRKPAGESSRNHLLYLYKYNADRRGLEFSLSLEEFSELTKGDCFYCGAEPSQVKLQKGVNPYVYNGIDRIDSSCGYVSGNVVSCCGTCNMAKNDMSQEDFYDWINRVHEHTREGISK